MLSCTSFKMDFFFGLIQACAYKSSGSWIKFTFICSMLCLWTSVECWSYFYSNNRMDWENARSWCKEHYTDMVAIQNQEEIGYLNNWLPKKNGYYWIGMRKINNIWTWVGTNKPLTKEATNWAEGEPNNGESEISEDCVEMYIKRDGQSGKWNDERCTKLKTALCYTASCHNDSCLHGECLETIYNYKCDCFEGFYGDKCGQVVQCSKDEAFIPDNGYVNCSHKHGNFSYDSLCQYSCEEGYKLSVQRSLRCTASGKWSEKPPTCELVQCERLSEPANGSMKCSNPLGPFIYQSTCITTCDEGYVLSGSPSIQCEASGSWNASQPLCVAVQCPALQDLENGFVSCGDEADKRFSYKNNCSFRCAHGYRMVGPSRVACTSAAKWSEQMPHCEVVRCPLLDAPENGHINYSSSESVYSSQCSFTCDQGYTLEGHELLTCDHHGNWTGEKPTCQAIICQNPDREPPLITLCSESLTELRPNSTCSFSCEEGFELQGANTIKCSDDGQWNKDMPSCKVKGCPAPEVPTNGQINCSASLSSFVTPETPHPLGVVCNFTCDEGRVLQGALSIECTNPGQWTSRPPTCTAVRCPLLDAPENGHITFSSSESVYSSQCFFTCDQGYTLEGHELLTCDHHGSWTGEKPTCQAPFPLIIVTTSVAAGGIALLSVVCLALWISKTLKKNAVMYELSSNSDIESPPQSYKRKKTALMA